MASIRSIWNRRKSYSTSSSIESFSACFISLTILTFHAALVATFGDDLVVETENGKVLGIRHHLPSLSVPVDAFLGIPFAKPPVGHLRFRHPHPIDKWSYVY